MLQGWMCIQYSIVRFNNCCWNLQYTQSHIILMTHNTVCSPTTTGQQTRVQQAHVWFAGAAPLPQWSWQVFKKKSVGSGACDTMTGNGQGLQNYGRLVFTCGFLISWQKPIFLHANMKCSQVSLKALIFTLLWIYRMTNLKPYPNTKHCTSYFTKHKT